jgi:hypothetical protein
MDPSPVRASRPPGGAGSTVWHPDLEWRETVRGSKPGDRYVRVATHDGFTRLGPGYLVPRPGVGEPTGGVARALARAKHLLLGTPIPTAREAAGSGPPSSTASAR